MSRGIDVSHHNGIVDWALVAGAGIEFAYVKATQGSKYVDPRFVANLSGASAAGLQHGVYHYLTPGDQASDQANHFLTLIQDRVGQLPPAVDVEPTFSYPGGPDLWLEVPLQDRVAKIVKFCSAVQQATGVVPMLYASPSFVTDMLGSDSQLGRYWLWVAEYGVSAPRIPAPFDRYSCWQYSESGSVDGAGTGVDLDIWNGLPGS